jgi:hypothetical protein
MRKVILALLMSSVLSAQTQIIVKYTTPSVGDTTDHADLISGQSATFTAAAYKNGSLVTRKFSWSVNPPGFARVDRRGRVVIGMSTVGYGILYATTKDGRGSAELCVPPQTMTIQIVARRILDTRATLMYPKPLPNGQYVPPLDNSYGMMIELAGVIGTDTSSRRDPSWGRCVHYQWPVRGPMDLLTRDGWAYWRLWDSTRRLNTPLPITAYVGR